MIVPPRSSLVFTPPAPPAALSPPSDRALAAPRPESARGERGSWRRGVPTTWPAAPAPRLSHSENAPRLRVPPWTLSTAAARHRGDVIQPPRKIDLMHAWLRRVPLSEPPKLPQR